MNVASFTLKGGLGWLRIPMALLAGWLAVSFSSAVSAAAKDRPNIIYLMADDMGWGDAGCYGQKHIQTPNIDALARDGTRFTNVYAGASVCAPSARPRHAPDTG